MELSHVRWLVADLEPCRAFYRDRLGLREVVSVPGVYAEYAAAGARVALYPADLMAAVVGRPVAGAAGEDVVLCLGVDDVDAEAARLAGAGVALVTTPHDQPAWYQRVAHVRDPAGHLIELWSPLATPA
jgi:catechol 2,3-dioxygenase-like lactoylglutathione lyase family enzyme